MVLQMLQNFMISGKNGNINEHSHISASGNGNGIGHGPGPGPSTGSVPRSGFAFTTDQHIFETIDPRKISLKNARLQSTKEKLSDFEKDNDRSKSFDEHSNNNKSNKKSKKLKRQAAGISSSKIKN